MNDADYKFYADMLYRESGLALTQDKTYLLESRLMPVASRFKLQGLDGIAMRLRTARDPDLQRAVVEAMTTNETSFFRDNTPFQVLKDAVLPYFFKARAAQKRISIWSAACSSGQEPYSLAMMLKEMGPVTAGWKFDIMATDLSQDILAQAKAGVYTQFEVQRGLPIQLLVKYFAQQGDRWVIKPELKDMVQFRTANLLTDIAGLGSFDIVLCRNVLIYFDVQTKAKVFQSLRGAVKQDGVLLLGGTETVLGVTDQFKAKPESKGLHVRSDSSFDGIKQEAGAAR